ncbi:MAG: hypothetical protein K8T89_20895 [Planctomycetes bacterium]|nr:hypothetical protein [Planctomycetota bacterium]
MNDTARSAPSAWFSAIGLAGFTVWLLLVRPGQLAPHRPYADLALFSTLVGAYSLYILSWKTHGILFSIIGMMIFTLSDRQPTDSRDEAGWILDQIFFLALFGVQLLIWSELNKHPVAGKFWLLAAVGMAALSALIWIDAEQASRVLNKPENRAWAILDQRMRICSFVLLALGGFLGWLLAPRRQSIALLAPVFGLAAPVAGFLIASLYAPVKFEHLTHGGAWNRLGSDLSTWWSQADSLKMCAGWCWTSTSVVISLMLIGFWRTVARGFKQRRKGESPIAWLLSLATILLLGALLPASSESLHPLGLLWLGIALSVFAVADLLLLFFEQLALPTPATGPSNVPRVGI